MRERKFDYLWIIQGNYGHGWEDLCAADSWREIRGNVKDYRENEPGTPHRTIRRRVLREPTEAAS